MNELRLQKKFKAFKGNRKQILKDTEQFVRMIVNCCSEMVEDDDYYPNFVASETARPLMESLCYIHGLYGYPDANSPEIINKDAVREIVLNEVSVDGRTFADFCAEAREDEFWQLREFWRLREPAHLFLQMVQYLFGCMEGAGDRGKQYLETLPDVNYLKPAVWAQHKDRPECFGVSLGVRPFVRPLYLYNKLRQLRTAAVDVHNGVDLSDVTALKSKINKKRLIKEDPSSDQRTKWEVKKDTCDSCLVFFWFNERCSNPDYKPSFPPFGNCAEYDIIRTRNLDYILSFIAGTTPNHWGEFESACRRHLTAFEHLTENMEGSDPSEMMQEYFISVGDAKVLSYEMYSPPKQKNEPDFRLIADDWSTFKKKPKISKRRRKTPP